MKLYGQICSVVTAAALFITASPIAGGFNADAATNVSVSPDIPYEINGGKFEGWGS